MSAINIFFVPGMFGTLLDYLISAETLDILIIDTQGTAHRHYKEFHPRNIDELTQLTNQTVRTPIYPFRNNMPLQHVIDFLNNDRNIIVCAKDLRSAELNLLFSYHKVPGGPESLFRDINNAAQWNKSYTTYKDMQVWELRECFSLYYTGLVSLWINPQITGDYLRVFNTDLLFHTKNEFIRILGYVNQYDAKVTDDFVVYWQKSQQYITDEFLLIDQIVAHTLEQSTFTWEPISIISESIIQKRLRDLGYEIRCDGLNEFPSDSHTLYNLLEKNNTLHA